MKLCVVGADVSTPPVLAAVLWSQLNKLDVFFIFLNELLFVFLLTFVH